MVALDIQDNGALASLKINSYTIPVQEIKTATELDLSQKGLKSEDAIVISALIAVLYITVTQNFATNYVLFATQDNGALSKLDISSNEIPQHEQSQIKQICEANSVVCTL